MARTGLLTRFDFETLVEALAEAEVVRPAQYARRRVFARRGVAGGKAKFLAAILAGVWRSLGLLDDILSRAGVDVARLPRRERACARLSAYLLLDARCRESIECKRLVTSLCEPARRLLDALEKGEIEVDSNILEYSMPEWMLEKLRELLPGEWRLLVEAFNKPPPVTLRVNTIKASFDRVFLMLVEEGREPRESRWAPRWGIVVGNPRDLHESRVLRHGYVYPQDEASIVASLVLAPEPGETVFDLAAAPGGKTGHMAALMRNRGRIIAIDKSSLKSRLLERNMRKLGVRIVEVRVMDARDAPRVFGENVADRVMLDAPCTGSGTLARNPDLRWRITPEYVEAASRLQYELLEAAVRLAKPGSRILYATCSIFREENEDVVKRILENHDEVTLVPLKGPFDPSPWLPGTMRAWPHRHGTIGFFYALLEKTRG